MRQPHIVFLLAFGLLLQFALAQNAKTALQSKEPVIELIRGNFPGGCIYIPLKRDMHTNILPPENFLLSKTPTANIQVTYNGFSPQAQAAFQFAVDIWASTIVSNWPIRVGANWESLDPNVLGSAGSNGLAIVSNQVLMPIALAEAMFEQNVNGANEADIVARFNKDLSNWYLGTDGQTPAGKYDFVTVVLHELGHGLGFFGSMDVENGQGSWGFEVSSTTLPLVYDQFAENGAGQQLMDTEFFANPSAALAQQLTSNNVFFNAPFTNPANGGSPARLYAPNPWEGGSSFSHLNENTYPAGNENSLMTPAVGTAEAIHSPGPVMLAMFQDMGWEISSEGQIGIRWEEIFPSASIPAGWITVDRDGNGTSWNYVSQVTDNGGNIVVLPQAGARFWESSFESANGMLIDDWLISPQLPTIQAGDVLKFYTGAVGPNFPDSLKVWISETDNNINSFDQEIAHFVVPGPLGSWHEFSFDLSAFEDKQIYLGINYFHTNGGPSGESSNHVWVDHFILEGLIVSGIEDEETPALAREFSLEQNFPNPFNPSTQIRYSIPTSSPVKLRVYNVLGQEVALLVNAYQPAGNYTVEFDARNLTSGIYFYQIEAGDFMQVRKMLLTK